MNTYIELLQTPRDPGHHGEILSCRDFVEVKCSCGFNTLALTDLSLKATNVAAYLEARLVDPWNEHLREVRNPPTIADLQDWGWFAAEDD